MKILGNIIIPIIENTTIECADCTAKLDDRWGFHGVKIITSRKGKKDTERWVCENCAHDLFAEQSPHSIFG